MTTKKRMHVSLSPRDAKLIEELEVELDETKTAVVRRSVEHYHEHIFDKHKEDLEC